MLRSPAVADGDLYRLLTSAFMHYGITHLLFNMYALYVVGPPLENWLGRLRFTALYVVERAGRFGPGLPALTAQRGDRGCIRVRCSDCSARHFVVGKRLNLDVRWVIGLIAINLAFTFVIPLLGGQNISWQGHIGGLVTGAVVAAAYAYAPRARRTLIQISATVAILVLFARADLVADNRSARTVRHDLTTSPDVCPVLSAIATCPCQRGCMSVESESVPTAGRALPPAVRSRRRPPAVRAGFHCGADISGLRRAQQRHVRFRSGAAHALHGGLGVALAVAVTVAYACAFTLSYVLNRILNFRSHAAVGPQFAVYVVVIVVNYLAFILGVSSALAALGVEYHVARIVAGACEAVLHIQRDAVGGVPELRSLSAFRACRTLRTGPAPETP